MAADGYSVNEMDRFHLVEDVIDRLPRLGAKAAYFKQAIDDKLFEHKQYIAPYGDDMTEIRDWQWAGAGEVRKADTSADNI